VRSPAARPVSRELALKRRNQLPWYPTENR
jgi:hypothetical protein